MTFGWNTTKNKFVLENGTILSSAKKHVVLEMTIYSHLAFYSHLKQFSKYVANKLNTLTRTAPYLNCKKGESSTAPFLQNNETTAH